jgi:hypothetical protein
MDWKSTLKQEAEKALLKKAAGKILPMEDAKPAIGWKAKLAGILAIVGTLATVLSQYLGG